MDLQFANCKSIGLIYIEYYKGYSIWGCKQIFSVKGLDSAAVDHEGLS